MIFKVSFIQTQTSCSMVTADGAFVAFDMKQL